MRLENIFWDEREKKLRFSHGVNFSHEKISNVSKRDYEGKATAGGNLSGTFIEDGIRHEWNADKIILCGLWSSSSFPNLKLYLSKMEGEFSGWKGKVFYDDAFQSWQALNNIEWDGRALKFEFPGVSFSGVIDGAKMKGRIRYQRRRLGFKGDGNEEEIETEWEARKAPDEIPF